MLDCNLSDRALEPERPRRICGGDCDECNLKRCDCVDEEPDDEPVEERLEECPVCGEVNGPIGKLGRLLHFCCRACGMWYSQEEEE